MANTCCNSIRITGPATDLEKIHAAALAAQNENDNQLSDLYRMLLRLGCTEHELEKTRCREDFTGGPVEYDPGNGTVLIESESANCFQYDAWRLVRKRFPAVTVFYRADEPACRVFITNDREGVYFKSGFRIDWMTDDGEGEIAYIDDAQGLVEYVRKNIDPAVTTEAQARAAVDALEGRGGEGLLLDIAYEDDSGLL